MIRKLTLSLLLPFLFLVVVKAQDSRRQIIPVDAENLNQPLMVQLPEVSPFLATSVKWTTNGQPGNLRIRHRDEAGNWTEWQLLQPDEHAPRQGTTYISPLLFLPANCQEMELSFTPVSYFAEAEIHLYNPGDTPEKTGSTQAPDLRSSCPCPQPEYQGRLDWCPTGNCPQDPTPDPTNVTHIIIHHSAGVNSSNDWAAVVRSIWDYHVNTNGWDDIGYNWLIDPNGVLYEGRGDGLQGAHFCGQNGNTVGICVLGNFQTVTPSNASLLRLQDYLAWQTCDIGVDPLAMGFHEGSGLDLFYISGHRDGCSTACPGDQFYPIFPQLREWTDAYINNDCMPVAEPIELTAEALTTTSVQLDWAEVLEAETGYEIERSQGTPDNFTWIASVNAATTAFIDAGLTPGDYYYRVRAFGPSGTSAFSNEAFVSTLSVSTSAVWIPTDLLIHPNPFRDQLEVQLSDAYRGPVAFELLSLDGKVVQRLGTIEKSTDLLVQSWTINQLPAAVYLLRGTTSAGTFVKAIVKQ